MPYDDDIMKKGTSADPDVRWPVWLLVADAIAYWIALYYCVLITFFFRDGVISAGMRATGLSVAVVVIMIDFASRWVVGPSWKRVLVLDVLFFLFVGSWLAWHFSGIGTGKGLSFVWAAIEWWKLPANLLLMIKTAPAEFVLFWIVVFFVIAGMARGRRKLSATVIFLFVIFYSVKLAGIEAGIRLPAYLFFDIGLVIAAIAGLKGFMRAFARIMIIDSTFVFIFLFYLGVVPAFNRGVPDEAQGLKRIYPAAGQRAEFPLVFLRDMIADQTSGYLFTAYGPTSGMVRVRIDNGKADIIHNPGIVRVLWSRPEMDEFYALDWMYADFYRIGKTDFRIRNKTDIYGGLLVTPMSYAIVNGKLYVVSTDFPALTRFDLATLKREATIDFRKAGVTKFRSGAWKCVADESGKKLFVELGPVDLKAQYAIARVDLDTFRVDAVGHIPEGGLELITLPVSGNLLAPSFFSNNIYEIDPVSLQTKRVIAGPLTCRNLIFDRGRNLLYATSYTRGELSVIDYATGKTIKQIRTGKKPSSLTYDPIQEKLYFGSGSGIFSVDLKMFLKR